VIEPSTASPCRRRAQRYAHRKGQQQSPERNRKIHWQAFGNQFVDTLVTVLEGRTEIAAQQLPEVAQILRR
jgi:hypothetical protein